MQYAANHARVRFAHHGRGSAASSSFERGAGGSAINQDRGLVGGANAVGISGKVRLALFDPPRSATEALVGKGGVEPDDNGIGNIVRIVGGENESSRGKLSAHAGSSEDKEAAHCRPLVAQKLDGSLGGCIKLIFGG